MLPVRCKRARRCMAELLQNDEAESGGVGVNDSYMEVLQQYEGETLNVRRGRGAWICEQSDGIRLLKEYRGTLRRLEFEEAVLTELENAGLEQVDQYVRSREGALIATGVVLFVFILITCLNIKEKSTVDVDAPSIKQMFKALLQNDQAMTVVITIVLINTSVYITSNLVIYFFKYDFGGADWYNGYTLFNTFGGAIQILSMMILFPLLRKFLNTIRIFYVSFAMAIAGYLVLLVLVFTTMSNVFILFIPAFFIFAANGMLLVLTTIFLANTVDYGELKNKRRDESVIFSMQTFVVKLASGVAALVVSICLSLSHLSSNTDADAAVTTGGSVAGLRMTMTVIPIIGLIIALIYFHKKYILTDKKMEEITKGIKERRN